ncbi:MAG: tetratricopeptide repeat protein [Planctomycetota bacterium]
MKHLTAVLCLLAACAAADTLFLKGQPAGIEVVVSKDAWDKLVYVVEDTTLTANWDTVEKVEYKTYRGSAFEKADLYFSKGGFEEALKEYANAVKNMRDKWVKPQGLYKSGLCLFNLGRYADAVRVFEAAAAEAENRYEPDALQKAGECYLRIKDYPKAKELLSRITEQKYGPNRSSFANALMVDLKFESGDYDGALADYGRIVAKLADKLDLNRIGIEIKMAVCTARKGAAAPARTSLEDCVARLVNGRDRRKYAGAEVALAAALAEAYNAIGNTWFDAQPRDAQAALRAYLHTAVTYRTARGPAVVEASFKAAQCFVELMAAGIDAPEIRGQMIARTRELLDQARELYAGQTGILRKINEVADQVPSK